MSVATNASLVEIAAVEKSPGYWAGVVRRFRRDPVAMIALAVVLALLLMAVFAPWVAPNDPYRSSMLRRLRPIGTPGFLLGTDELGRDMVSRLIYGARLSLLMGVTPVFIAFTAGYLGGRVNTVLMRTIDVFFAFPSVLLAIALSGAMGAGIFNGLLSLTVVFIPPIARIAESVTTAVRKIEYVEAARASGASSFTIVRVHVPSSWRRACRSSALA
jgi:peptide/nickel transport system permease protein